MNTPNRERNEACMRPLSPALVIVMCVFATSHAHAQQPTITSRPPITWLGLNRAGDASGAGTRATDPVAELAIEPLRLGLLGDFVPGPTNDPSCVGSSEAAGVTGGSGFPSQRLVGMNLFGSGSASSPLRTPRLMLFGFSRGGCPLNRAVGGGLTFIAPLRPNVFFVASGGAIYLPNAQSLAPQRPGGGTVGTQVRGDLVFTRSGGRSFNLGVGTRGMSFGGLF